MLKGVKKGIKKKIKGKKDKKEDDLFDPEQLEKYKRELEEAKKARQQQDEESGYAGAAAAAGPSAGHEDDEEWQRFKMLTSGVDVLVNKVSDDLERIKESSFFQRNKISEQNRLFASEKPSNWKEPEPEPEVENQDDLLGEGGEHDEAVPEGAEGGEDEPQKVPDSPDIAPVELDDSLFDTTFVEAIATGEIKLAYIPDSPTHEDDDDPFDTSAVADVVKRIEEEEKKAARQVNLGNAVEFLTGKADKTGIERPRTRPGQAKARPRPHAINLLGDFDEGNIPTAPISDVSKKNNDKTEKSTDLFDKILDTPIKDNASPLLEKIDLLAAKPVVERGKESEPHGSPKAKGIKDVISEFDVISQLDPISGSGESDALPAGIPSSIPSSIAALLTTAPPEPEEDEWDEEFAALAAESAKKQAPPPPEEEPVEEEEEDPFDTTFVDKTAAHGKCELKIIENEVLGDVKTEEGGAKSGGADDEDDFDFDPRAGESPPKSLEIQNAPKINPLEDLTPTAVKAPTIEPHVKAGGPTLVETEGKEDDKPEDIDPFDTSKLETVLPGKAELKLLEEELLSSVEQAKLEQPKLPEKIVSAIIKAQKTEDDDFDFDPRKDEVKQHMLDLHDVSHQAFDTVSKVLTPQQEEDVEIDPFDTSAVAASGLIPGPLELKLLEDELVTPTAEPIPTVVPTVQPVLTRKATDDDFDFDPRAGQPAPVLAPKPPPTTEELFDSTMDFAVDKPLTPLQELPSTAAPEPKLCPTNVDDPFDTSGIQIENYLAKSELRQVEEELLNAPAQPMPIRKLPVVVAVELKKPPPQQVIPEPQPPPQAHLLEALTPTEDTIKPLTPQEAPTTGVISVFNPSPGPYIDPFDTSIAEAVIPGKTEIKLLEEELGVGGGRRLSDPDFDPREPNHPANQMISQPLTPMPVQPVLKPTSNVSQAKPAEVDPFDTSAAETVMPGKAELKALENELL